MESTGLIFVAVAVAWAAYIIPMLRRHYDDVSRSRSVDRFSHSMRVLARRDPVAARTVVTPARGESVPEVTVKGASVSAAPSPVDLAVRREAAVRAAGRRRRVFLVLLLANVVVASLAMAHLLEWAWLTIPGGLVVVWLVLCRVMVKSEHAADDRAMGPSAEAVGDVSVDGAADDQLPADYAVERNDQGFDEVAPTADTSTIATANADGTWDPVSVPLPTYVSKPAAARRTVRTIDLNEPGAWTSGRTEESAAMSRAAEEAAAKVRDAANRAAAARRAVGS